MPESINRRWRSANAESESAGSPSFIPAQTAASSIQLGISVTSPDGASIRTDGPEARCSR